MNFPITLFFSLLGIGFLRASESSQIPLLSPSFDLDSKLRSAFPNVIKNAPHIFNTLNGAMRPWSSSLHHNGMSFFPVTVPANTLLYHGRPTSEPVQGLGWLSFEVYFAEFFARFKPQFIMPPARPLPFSLPPLEDVFQGYLHTYRTTHELTNILYLDGLSAAKSTLGTLDTQDSVLLRNSNFRDQPERSDTNRAKELCDMFTHVQGIIRTVIGFEIIICNFSASLEFVGANQRPPLPSYPERVIEKQFMAGEGQRGVSQRFRGIGGGRALVDFSSMVSAYFYPLNLTNPDPHRPDLPRINPKQGEVIEEIRSEVLTFFKSERQTKSIDWQGVVDMIVTWYSDRLAYVIMNQTTKPDMLSEINFLLDHYIDYRSMNHSSAQENCVAHYLVPPKTLQTSSDHLVHKAISTVMEKLCEILFGARRDLAETEGMEIASQVKSNIQDLMSWLNWSTWRECESCGSHEVCFVAVWPWGEQKDHYQPGCVGVREVSGRSGYWDYDL